MTNTIEKNILEKIVADKRIELVQLKQELPLANFIDQLQPTSKDMYKALAEENAGFILECKKASPSKGLIREVFDVTDIAGVYSKYASAISVLTDAKYFQGCHDYLKTVSDMVDCPVLNKDFFIDEYQIHLGRYYGADAILLMLSVLSDEEYNALAKVAKSYNMAILTEVSNVAETERAIALDAKLIGINNRNLRDLSTDLTRTFELAPMIPDDRLIISESGIYTNKQVRELAPAVDGFLVGSSVMAKDDIDLACRELIYGTNKVCGLTSVADISAVIDAGAIYAGLIFAEKSPRCISFEQARRIKDEIFDSPIAGINFVGVFKDQSLSEVANIANHLALDVVQLHGSESDSYIAELREHLSSSCAIVKAVSVNDSIPPFSDVADSILLDAKQGGSGEAFNWQLLEQSQQDLSKAMLAGGLSTDNIASAQLLCNDLDLSGLDLNSGVESAPGIKDHQKLTQAFALIRRY
ncbi:bifunctional indole-3-glycerol-phosphate synthase TrpC/phosphoribosylanthranilate isomerase TrpF [Thalassotalea sp. ND16A]|uniref:bifunctional indole-3-glycerol-phosphate synthase TrpC/phosphoribosylanthranilate isomerase TrpF n=1 Tax=Thalassotalea sp. ND16A TaxID=1535422 RepID=UPI000519F517|nr:bifunctional indole-3-glycerol-phosphate synthase TrpC/phosphoribosylanthranilate isomerase TrpF [Thalassotalea sp. ND16A]KGK00922.1 Indole-3-glycerol-phosphate synthase, Phosphoribosylanthranilate isomerase [Thalassotalea sp. ND16A]